MRRKFHFLSLCWFFPVSGEDGGFFGLIFCLSPPPPIPPLPLRIPFEGLEGRGAIGPESAEWKEGDDTQQRISLQPYFFCHQVLSSASFWGRAAAEQLHLCPPPPPLVVCKGIPGDQYSLPICDFPEMDPSKYHLISSPFCKGILVSCCKLHTSEKHTRHL